MTRFALAPILCYLAFFAALAVAGETDVTLFGQKCKLQGPVEKSALISIHSIGPEQVEAPTSIREPSSKFKPTLERIRKVTGIPPALDIYREKLAKRFAAEVALLEAFESARKAKKADPLSDAAKKNLREAPAKEIDALAKKLEAAKFAPSSNAAGDQIFEAWQRSIEPDPAEDFHRTIQKLNIKYACSYDDESGEETDDESAAPPSPRPRSPTRRSH